MSTICIYHANCFDGMAAALAVRLNLGDEDVEYIPMHYGQDVIVNKNGSPVIIGRETDLIVVDFSFPRERMIALRSASRSMIVLDHHKTAQADCEGLAFCKFDLEKSGARLAWEYFHPEKQVPPLIAYIEDRDLWRFALPDSKEINAYIQSYPINMDTYDMLYYFMNSSVGIRDAKRGGESIERYKNTMVDKICANARLTLIGEYWVPTVQTGILMSEVGHQLCKTEFEYVDHYTDSTYMTKPHFAASYFDDVENNLRIYSLRSIGDFDVSIVAKRYGGGGHKNAAGFQVKL